MIDAAIQIGKSLPETKLVLVTMHNSPAYLEAALSAGAMGYVLKSAAREELPHAIRSVPRGQIYVPPRSFERASGAVCRSADCPRRRCG
jgi:DNA-binding NarL/FixJ family response regulator